MQDQTFRLFINNVVDNIDENALREKLSQFGNVSSIEIKRRKNVIGNQTPAFAYINISTSHENLQKCFKDFSTQKFKGLFIDISIAKESFMERLKREREEQNKHNKTTVSDSVENRNPETLQINGELHQEGQIFHSSLKTNTVIKTKIHCDNSETKFNGSLMTSNAKIEKKNLVNEPENSKPPLSISEKKRIQSVLEKKRDYQKQKSLIQKALANIDTKPKSKIIFDNDDTNYEEHKLVEHSVKGKKKRINESKSQVLAEKKSFKLFDNDDDEDTNEIVNDVNFEVKEHFEGLKGQKLLELQNKFKNDKRFALDARFLEDSSSEKSNDSEIETEKITDDKNDNDEKEEQLRILEKVLGRIIVPPKLSDKGPSSSKKRLAGMLRFDPDQEDHLKYEIKAQENDGKLKKRKRKDSLEKDKIEKSEIENKPQVSTEKFYKVTEKLKDAFQSNQQFSLLGTFGKLNEETFDNEEVQNTAKEIKDTKLPLGKDHNPFRYDSSSSDSEEEENEKEIGNQAKDTEENPSKSAGTQNTQQNAKLGLSRHWNEPFFFKNDDYRLQEGLDFIKRMEVDEQSDFVKLRRNIKEVAKAKVRNNQRKTRQFKKKLGGKKRIKIKRALKR